MNEAIIVFGANCTKSLAASTTLAWLFFFVSAPGTGLIVSATLAGILTASNREGSACKKARNCEPSQDLLDTVQIHTVPPFGSLQEESFRPGHKRLL